MKRSEIGRKSYFDNRMTKAVCRSANAPTEQEKTICRKWFMAWATLAKLGPKKNRLTDQG
jgi:hypothetical protein